MSKKTYLKWYNKIGYGSGDIAGNVIYAFLTSFVMIYLTDTVGLQAGIVGTLMMVSKIFDGFTDIIFGSLIDKTKSKMGKARPWMFWPYFGNCLMLIAIFVIPSSWGEVSKYVYFFIVYTLLNAVFFTANNIAYSALTALITKNNNERVQMGSIRFIFAFGTSLLIQSVTVGAVKYFGGGVEGWRTTAIIYGLIGLVVNTISVFSVKELKEEKEEEICESESPSEKLKMSEMIKLLFSNKYYILICGIYILTQLYSSTLSMGIYYMTYIMGNPELLGTFAIAINIPMICGLLITPYFVRKIGGMYKINLGGYFIATLARAGVIWGASVQSVPIMLFFTGLAAFAMSPMQGDLNALIAACSDYTFATTGKRIDGTMYSCSSLGVKIGSGIGTALFGWLLAASGYVANMEIQPESCINMLDFMYLWLPMILNLLITILLSFLTVEKANKQIPSIK